MKTLIDSTLIYISYAFLSAACYVGATVVMKYFDRLSLWNGGGLIAGTLAAAVFFEIAALKTERFGMILLLILACECAFGLLLSWLWFRESYTLTEIFGFALIVAGIGLVKA